MHTKRNLAHNSKSMSTPIFPNKPLHPVKTIPGPSHKGKTIKNMIIRNKVIL